VKRNRPGDEEAAATLKACWLVCPCSSVPAPFPLFSAGVGLLRSASCLHPFLSTGFSFGSLSFLQILLQGMEQRPKGSPCLFRLLIILRKLNLFHLFSLLSTLRLLPLCFPFSFLSQWRKDQGKKTSCSPVICTILSCVFSYLSLCCFFFAPFSLVFSSFYALSSCFFFSSPLGQQPRLLYSLYTTLFRKQILH